MPPKAKFTIQPIAKGEVRGADREILAKTQDDGVYPLSMAKEIRLDRIRPDPNQPRRTMDEEALRELAASIREQGVLQPIVVQYVPEGEGGYFMLTHGERRWKAAMMAGLETIPAIIREEADSTTRLVRQLMENIQREDLNAVDRARALQALKKQLGDVSWDEVGQKVGISKRRVLQLVATTELPPEIQDDIRAERITEKETRPYRGLPPETQLEIHQARQQEGLTPQEVAAIVKRVKGEPGFTIAQAVAEVKAQREAAKAAQAREKAAPAPPGAPEPVGEAAAAEPQQEAAKPPLGEPGFTSEEKAAAAQETEPLATLSRLEAALGALDLSRVDPAPLQALLRAIIAKARALLERLGRREVDEEEMESAPPGEGRGDKPPAPADDLT